MQNKMERLTRRARKAISQAQELAFEMQSAEIEPYHLLLVLCRIDGSASQAILDDFDIIDVKLSPLIHVRYQTKSKSSSHPLNQHRVVLSDAVKQTLELSVDSARRLNAHNIGTE
ncbi:MAG: Clp protease N-terminal domain-containing protein, partial [Chloroflexota bacterium]